MIVFAAVLYCIGGLFTALDFVIDLPKRDRASSSSAAAAGTAISVFWPLSWGVILVLGIFAASESAGEGAQAGAHQVPRVRASDAAARELSRMWEDVVTDERIIGTMPAQRPGKSKQDYATPVAFIAAVERRFGPLVLDLAAHARNTRVARYFSIEEGVDSLAQDWTKERGNLWLNPPFNFIEPWAKKCSESAAPDRRIFFLTPASVGANWFADHVHGKAKVLGLVGRLSFDGVAPYPKDCMLSVFGVEPGFDVWRWR